jgi:hypothetical protein
METSQTGQGTKRSPIIIVIVAILMCCCCLAAGAAAYFGYQTYQAAQAAQQAIQGLEIPQVPFDPSNPIPPEITIPGIPGLGDIELPQGGRTDEITRTAAWTSVLLMAPIYDCTTPSAPETTIEVIQEPDAGGAWVERWNLACGEGTAQPFDITFTPQAGITNVSIEVPQ